MNLNNILLTATTLLLLLSFADCDVHNLWKQVDDVSGKVQESTVEEMINRITDSFFDLKINVGAPRIGDGLDMVVVNYTADTRLLSINATNGVAAAWGFNHFLKYRCNSHISWETRNVNTSACQPTVDLVLTANDKYRYYMNVCTPGYSFAWWQWSDWETHIDWMALNGINLPLAFTGQEEIWRRVWTKLGLSQEDLDEYFVGPAFLPWGRMGNIRGWGGPLTPAWHKIQLEIQHKILDRMRSFGMIPVLPAFSGKVPHGYAKLHPSSNFTSAGWNYFPDNLTGVLLLDPIDPLFDDIGKLFIEEYTKEFGTNHIYNCDTFNEMRPPTNSTDFLAKVGKSVYAGMSQADPDAVWMMQGWLFLDSGFWGYDQIKALLTSVTYNPHQNVLLINPPSLQMTDETWYTLSELYTAWGLLLNASQDFNDSETYKFDLVDVTRQALVNQAPIWYDLIRTAYNDKSLLLVHQYGLMFMRLLHDLDRILGTNSNFMLGPWLESAKALATTPAEEANYEYNARNMSNNMFLYIHWSKSLKQNVSPGSGAAGWKVVSGQVPFNQDAYHADYLKNIGEPFCVSRKRYPIYPHEDTITVAREIYEEWSKYILISKIHKKKV